MRKIVLFALFALTVFGCSSSDSDGGPSDTFNRSALLQDWAENIIVPSYVNYDAKVDAMNVAIGDFTASPNQIGLDNVRAAWLEAYKAYQFVGMYEIGPAETKNLKGKANTFPASVSGIEANITSGTYNFDQFAQFDKQGFPAIDYLINGLGASDDEIISAFDTSHKQYLTACGAELGEVSGQVLAEWTGSYSATFIANSGSSVSSSVNKMTNLFVKYLEKDIRTGKLGIPAGLFSNGTTFPDKVEAYYKADVSRELLLASIAASSQFFKGQNPDDLTVGQGLKSYLDHINATRDDQALSGIISNQFNAVNQSINTLDENLSQQVFTDNSKMVAAYNVLQQQVVYVKLDMLQALSITIDYVDGDGD